MALGATKPELSAAAPSSGFSTLRVPAAALFSAGLFATAMAWQIGARSALTMDELHTLLVARLIAAGESVPFYLGSVSRYEGGSWLICWPVALLLRLGAWGSAATCWAAGSIALVTVALSSLWLGRRFGPLSALCLGPLLAVCAPEFVHYSYRAWGSLPEALVVYPLAAFGYEAWLSAGRRPGGSLLLGLLLAAAIVLSYLHMVTALLFVVLHQLDSRGLPRGSVALQLVLVTSAAVAGFGTWLWLAVPYLEEALVVRGGLGLVAGLGALLWVRLDRILPQLPYAWLGQHSDGGLWPVLLATGLCALALSAAVTGWRRGGSARRLSVLWCLLIPTLSVGHLMADHPDVIRYYLPWLCCSLALIAASGPRRTLIALVLGLTVWLSTGRDLPYQDPASAYLELGANALHRFSDEPHRKFELLIEEVPGAWRSWFAFGYGLDTGTRYAQATRAMAPSLRAWQQAGRDPGSNLRFVLADLEAWVPSFEASHSIEEDRAAWFFRGLGAGLMADGQLDALESTWLELPGSLRLRAVRQGVEAQRSWLRGEPQDLSLLSRMVKVVVRPTPLPALSP